MYPIYIKRETKEILSPKFIEKAPDLDIICPCYQHTTNQLVILYSYENYVGC